MQCYMRVMSRDEHTVLAEGFVRVPLEEDEAKKIEGLPSTSGFEHLFMRGPT